MRNTLYIEPQVTGTTNSKDSRAHSLINRATSSSRQRTIIEHARISKLKKTSTCAMELQQFQAM